MPDVKGGYLFVSVLHYLRVNTQERVRPGWGELVLTVTGPGRHEHVWTSSQRPHKSALTTPAWESPESAAYQVKELRRKSLRLRWSGPQHYQSIIHHRALRNTKPGEANQGKEGERTRRGEGREEADLGHMASRGGTGAMGDGILVQFLVQSEKEKRRMRGRRRAGEDRRRRESRTIMRETFRKKGK